MLLLWAVRAPERKIGDEPADHIRITWQREVIDARIVRQAEMEARQAHLLAPGSEIELSDCC